MFYERAFTINGTDIVAAQNMFEAKDFWLKTNLLAKMDPSIREANLEKDGLLIEVQSEMEAVELLNLMLPGSETYFKKTKDGMLLVWISLKEALRNRDEPRPYYLAKVGN